MVMCFFMIINFQQNTFKRYSKKHSIGECVVWMSEVSNFNSEKTVSNLKLVRPFYMYKLYFCVRYEIICFFIIYSVFAFWSNTKRASRPSYK